MHKPVVVMVLVIVLLPARAQVSAHVGVPEPAPAPAAPPSPLWEAGVFAVTGSQPAYPGSRQQVVSAIALPFVIYRGPVFRAEQGGLGVRAVKTASTELDVGLAGSFGSAPGDNDARRGMPSIGTLAELGPRMKLDLGDGPLGGRWRASLPLRAVFDVSHSFDFRGIAFEPEIGWGTRSEAGWGYGLSLGLLMGNARLADTFYGVAPQFATAARAAYEARGGLIATRLSLNLSKRLNTDWRFFVSGRFETVAGAANRSSPLVDKRSGAAIDAGLAWTWARSERPAHD